MHVESRDNRARRIEAASLCAHLAELTKDPGGKGYAEGMAQRLRTRPEQVSVEYVERLRAALAERETAS